MHKYRKLYPVLGAVLALGLTSAFAEGPLVPGVDGQTSDDASYAQVAGSPSDAAAGDIAALADSSPFDDLALTDPLASPAAAPAGPQPSSANATAAAPVHIDPMALPVSQT